MNLIIIFKMTLYLLYENQYKTKQNNIYKYNSTKSIPNRYNLQSFASKSTIFLYKLGLLISNNVTSTAKLEYDNVKSGTNEPAFEAREVNNSTNIRKTYTTNG